MQDIIVKGFQAKGRSKRISNETTTQINNNVRSLQECSLSDWIDDTCTAQTLLIRAEMFCGEHDQNRKSSKLFGVPSQISLTDCVVAHLWVSATAQLLWWVKRFGVRALVRFPNPGHGCPG